MLTKSEFLTNIKYDKPFFSEIKIHQTTKESKGVNIFPFAVH